MEGAGEVTAKDRIKRALVSGDSERLHDVMAAWIRGTLTDEEASDQATIYDLENELRETSGARK